MSKLPLVAMGLLVAVSLYNVNVCQARYLPTRSQEDRLVRLRELIQELLKSEDKKVPQQKRDQYGAGPSSASGGPYFIGAAAATAAEDASADEGYPLTFDNRDVDPRLARRLCRQQQIFKT